jgi:hypothetical protein
MTTAFQSNAFQDDGFQVDAAIVADLGAVETGDSLQSTATIAANIVVGTIYRPIPAKLPTIHARLKVKERGDSCTSTATIGFSPVTLDNDLLLIAA